MAVGSGVVVAVGTGVLVGLGVEVAVGTGVLVGAVGELEPLFEGDSVGIGVFVGFGEFVGSGVGEGELIPFSVEVLLEPEPLSE